MWQDVMCKSSFLSSSSNFVALQVSCIHSLELVIELLVGCARAVPKNSDLAQFMWDRNVMSLELELLVPWTFSGGLYIQ